MNEPSGKHLRLWILGSAVGCFLAGMGACVVLPEMVSACCPGDAAADPDAQYVAKMTEDFQLSTRQQQMLRIVMQRYKDEALQVYLHANFDQLPASLQGELTAARRRWTDRIHALLTQEQQQRYDEKARASGSVK